MLREVNQLSYEEIAAVTGLKLGTVRSRINRARTHFRKIIEPLLEDGEWYEILNATMKTVRGTVQASVVRDKNDHRVFGKAGRIEGREQSPETLSNLVPALPAEPIWANHAAPLSRISGTQYRVSMLCPRVGRPNRPRSAM